MGRKQKISHGGKREGAGRKSSLVKSGKILMNIEARQLEALGRYAAERNLGRSAAIRQLIDETLTEESDNNDRNKSGIPIVRTNSK